MHMLMSDVIRQSSLHLGEISVINCACAGLIIIAV
jgi:hypothetical protein